VRGLSRIPYAVVKTLFQYYGGHDVVFTQNFDDVGSAKRTAIVVVAVHEDFCCSGRDAFLENVPDPHRDPFLRPAFLQLEDQAQ
jgi:hypothetical protein